MGVRIIIKNTFRNYIILGSGSYEFSSNSCDLSLGLLARFTTRNKISTIERALSLVYTAVSYAQDKNTTITLLGIFCQDLGGSFIVGYV